MPDPVPQPAPLPEHWAIAIAQMNDATKQVVIQITGPAGTKVSFLPPLVAQQVGEQLIDHSRQAQSGLIVPTGVQLPNGQAPG